MKSIKDFIYFDSEKALSILSQLDGKIVTQIVEESEQFKDERNIRNYDLKLFKPEFGGIKSDRNSVFHTSILHHNVFNKLEEKLIENELLVNINNDIDVMNEVGFLSNALTNKFYIVVEGLINFEDFRNVQHILNRYNDIIEMMDMSSLSNIRNSPEYIESRDQIEKSKMSANLITDRNRKSKELNKINKLETELEVKIKDSIKSNKIDDWLKDGLNSIIDTFLKDRIIIRVYPYEKQLENHIIGNLKSDCFVDSNIETFMNSYGSKPNVKLTLLGLLTSIPNKNGDGFNSLDEYFKYTPEYLKQIALEKVFREMFGTLNELEKYVKFSRYPNVTVYPIAVYREIKIQDSSV